MSSPRAPSFRQFVNRIKAYARRNARPLPMLSIIFGLMLISFTTAHILGYLLPTLRLSSGQFIIEEAPMIGIEEPEVASGSPAVKTKSTNPSTISKAFDFVPGEEVADHQSPQWKRTATNLTKVQQDWSQNHDINRLVQENNSSPPAPSRSYSIGPSRNRRFAEFEAAASSPAVEAFNCNRSHSRVDICHMRGDVRVKGGPAASCKLYSNNTALHRIEEIQPYPRKWEPTTMERVQVVKLRGEGEYGLNGSGPALCDIKHHQPALLFSSGGFSGNLYHDFNDALIPLFISSFDHKGEIIFLVSDFKDWWITRYITILKQLSNYDLVNLGSDERVHCFSDMTVGLTIHGELLIDPDLMPHRETIHDFQNLLARAFRNTSTHYYPLWQTSPLDENMSSRPKLVILARLQSRVIVNEDEVVSLALQTGFDVRVLKPVWETDLAEIYHVLQAADVLLGVHGAALTHFLFLRPGSVFLQIIPIGVDLPAAQYFGDPAAKLGIQYISYKVRPEESSLSNTYNRNDPIIKDSDNIAAQSWEVRRTTYMEGQDVRLSLKRLGRELNYARLLAI